MSEEFNKELFDTPSYMIEIKKFWNGRIIELFSGMNFVANNMDDLKKEIVKALSWVSSGNIADKNLTPKTGYQRQQIEVPVNIRLNDVDTNIIVKFEIVVNPLTRHFPPTVDNSYVDKIEVIKSYFE